MKKMVVLYIASTIDVFTGERYNINRNQTNRKDFRPECLKKIILTVRNNSSDGKDSLRTERDVAVSPKAAMAFSIRVCEWEKPFFVQIQIKRKEERC